MRLEHKSEKELKKEILRIAGKYLDLNEYRLFFFGSRVSGKSFERSDIDVGIQGKQKLPLTAKMRIEEDLENLPTLYKIDLVDFNDVSKDFKKVALKYIEPINKSK
ncbi:nucleotidyltransferase domain-containing protein [bacterium]|nr:nucleotidyltransferase domain-containing protein [bacterium]